MSTLFSPYKAQAFFLVGTIFSQNGRTAGPVVGNVMAVKQWEIYFISSARLSKMSASQGRPEKKNCEKYHSHTEVIMEEKESL